MRKTMVLGTLIALMMPVGIHAQDGFSARFPQPVEYSEMEVHTDRGLPSMASGSRTYRTEGAMLGLVVGGLASYVLFTASQNQQCPDPCRGNTNMGVAVVLGAVVGGTLGSASGAGIEKPDRSRRGRLR